MIRTFTFATIQYLTWNDLPETLRAGISQDDASGWYFVPTQDEFTDDNHGNVVKFDSSNSDHRAARRVLDDSLPDGDSGITGNSSLILSDVNGDVVVSDYFIHKSFNVNNFSFNNFNSGDEKSTIYFSSDVKITSVSRTDTTVTDIFNNVTNAVMITVVMTNDQDDEITILVYDAGNDYQFRVADGEILDDVAFQTTYVTGNNLAPEFDNSSYIFNLAENADGSTTAVAIGSVAASDYEDDAITYSLSAAALSAGFAIDSATGAITYTGTGDDVFVVTLSDGSTDIIGDFTQGEDVIDFTIAPAPSNAITTLAGLYSALGVTVSQETVQVDGESEIRTIFKNAANETVLKLEDFDETLTLDDFTLNGTDIV